MDLFGDTASIFNSVVSNSYYGMLKEQILYTNFPPYPMRAIWNNRIQNGRRIEHSMYKYSNVAVSTRLQIYHCNYPLPLNSQKRLRYKKHYLWLSWKLRLGAMLQYWNIERGLFYRLVFFLTCRQLSVIIIGLPLRSSYCFSLFLVSKARLSRSFWCLEGHPSAPGLQESG